MKSISRTKNAILNISFGYIAQIGIMFLSFVGRQVFLRYLTADYLGINGLYANILTILSLPELGLDTAVVYSFYKPVAENDTKMIASLINYFKRVYYFLSIGLFGIGVAITPFLKFIVNSNLKTYDLVLYYLLFLVNTVASYFVAHKIALLSAYQEQRVQKVITLISQLLLQILYICVLTIWKSYYAYTIVNVSMTLISNTIISVVCSKRHKDVFLEKSYINIDKNKIISRIKSVFLYRIGTVLINSTDNILISILVSTMAVGYYSNYVTLTSSIQGFISIITVSLLSGVGNLSVEKNKNRLLEVFNSMLLFYHFIAAVGMIGIFLLSNELITIWIGEKYLFNVFEVSIISFNFYITSAISPIWMFRESNGLFDKVKYLVLIRALINLVLSVALGLAWGVFGVLAATAISLIITSFWYEPKILFKITFNSSSLMYWKKQAKYFFATFFSLITSYITIKHIGITGFFGLAIKAMIIIILTSVAFYGVSIKAPELYELIGIIIRKRKN